MRTKRKNDKTPESSRIHLKPDKKHKTNLKKSPTSSKSLVSFLSFVCFFFSVFHYFLCSRKLTNTLLNRNNFKCIFAEYKTIFKAQKIYHWFSERDTTQSTLFCIQNAFLVGCSTCMHFLSLSQFLYHASILYNANEIIFS